MKTLTRYIPAGYTEYKPEIGDYPKDLFAVYVDLAKPAAIFYSRKQSKHTFFNRFLTVEDMKKKINSTISNLMAADDRKVERAEARKAPTTYKVGDILTSSWGYDQTNVDFYIVTKTIGTRTVELQAIGSKIVSGAGGPTTHVMPDPERILNEKTHTKRVTNDSVNFSSYKWASRWNGKPQYETGAGWGH